jgi:BirA family biotin operon repressor/biotin-[acetyl-CoA-carboxylase] ligase
MVVYTDSVHFAEQCLPQAIEAWSAASFPNADLQRLSNGLFAGRAAHETRVETLTSWRYLFLVESAPRSQYDLLIEINQGETSLDDGILCVAGAGDKFHGFKNRPWSAAAGNIHLSVHLAPEQRIEHFGVGFIVLAAVSVIDAIDTVPGLEGRAGIKWVNDILINDAKVCGVLAYTQSVQDTVSTAVLGIGLNVETTPMVEPTPFVPKVASLRKVGGDPMSCRQPVLLDRLLQALECNYHLLLEGDVRALLDQYRQRSVVIGREVDICSDQAHSEPEVLARGRVAALGENLELLIEGVDQPFSRGRLILKS